MIYPFSTRKRPVQSETVSTTCSVHLGKSRTQGVFSCSDSCFQSISERRVSSNLPNFYPQTAAGAAR